MDRRNSIVDTVLDNVFMALENILNNQISDLAMIEKLEKRIDNFKEKLEYAKNKMGKRKLIPTC